MVTLTLSECPWIDKAAEIQTATSYLEMSQEEDEQTIALERKAMAAYRALRFTSVTAVQRENLKKETPFKLQLIPFHEDRNALLQQCNVIWSIIWGTACLSAEQLTNDQAIFDAAMDNQEASPSIGQGTDPFCRQQVIEKQTLWEGKRVRLLYPTSTLPNEEKAPHFLVVTKECRPDFSALIDEEALEVELVSRKLFQIFKEQGFQTGIKLQKNGIVGVTVPHFHQHVIFLKNQEDEKQALNKMTWNIFIGSSSLKDEQYKENYQHYKELLAPYLKEGFSTPRLEPRLKE